jgi:hypothetical protein
MAGDDVDFATAATTYLRGRAGFEKFPVRFSAGAPRNRSFRPLQTTVRFCGPIRRLLLGAMADGTVRPRRYGVMTKVG